MPSAFICHSGKDKDFARRLARRLSDFGITVWIDEEGLNIGDSLIQKISDAIEKTDYVLGVLSPNSVDSNWVQKELQMAMTKEIKGKKVVVMPLLLADCKLPAYLTDKVYADFRRLEYFENEIKKILKAMSVQYRESSPKQSSGEVVAFGVKSEIRVPVQDFEDVAIIGIDKAGVKTCFLSASEGYTVPFILSSVPPRMWMQIFDDVNGKRFLRQLLWRGARVVRDRIFINCKLDEIQRLHMREIKQDVETTNVKYRDYLRESAIQKAQEIKRKQEDEMRIEKELGGIEF